MKRIYLKPAARLVVAFGLMLSVTSTALAYSVLTHEAIIDSNWEDSIKQRLLERFPAASEEQLHAAHAYCYGGCIIQDMGYYPFGSKLFSDLVHYVRSGDFIKALLKESADINEYAFAIGALAHYAADTNGHSLAVNRAVPIIYPKLRAKYGDVITYADNPKAHILVEFAFDVLEVARGRYEPDAYHDFIGFEISRPVLERAFKKTYGLEMKNIFTDLDLALGTYRYAVSTLIPKMTKVAWETKKDEITKLIPGVTRERFIYKQSRAAYEKEWGKAYRKPGPSDKLLALLFYLVPKVGPFRALSFKPPTLEAEKLFLNSIDVTVEQYRAFLSDLRAGQFDLQNKNFDTGQPTRAGVYRLADKTYAKLLGKLQDHNFDGITPELREDILAFYTDLRAPLATKKNKGDWRNTLRALDRLKALGLPSTQPGQK